MRRRPDKAPAPAPGPLEYGECGHPRTATGAMLCDPRLFLSGRYGPHDAEAAARARADHDLPRHDHA